MEGRDYLEEWRDVSGQRPEGLLSSRGPGWRPAWRNILLFLLTLLSTYYVGSAFLGGGLSYCLPLMTILLAHELGHWLMSRRHRVRASLPYFIPFPLPPFGTLGAVIRMRSPMTTRKALLDIGAAGPFAGLVFALPAAVVGLLHSPVVERTATEGIPLGSSLLFHILINLVKGPIPEGQEVVLHPLAYAGWVGLFVTALNLLPIGQLDGGHILYSLIGQKSLKAFKLALGAFGLVCVVFYRGWILLIFLLLIFGLRHPPPLDPVTPLGRGRRAVGLLAFVIFFLCFTPVPFQILG